MIPTTNTFAPAHSCLTMIPRQKRVTWRGWSRLSDCLLGCLPQCHQEDRAASSHRVFHLQERQEGVNFEVPPRLHLHGPSEENLNTNGVVGAKVRPCQPSPVFGRATSAGRSRYKGTPWRHLGRQWTVAVGTAHRPPGGVPPGQIGPIPRGPTRDADWG